MRLGKGNNSSNTGCRRAATAGTAEVKPAAERSSGRMPSAAGIPGLVVAGRLGTPALGERRTGRTVRRGGAGQIRAVRLLPRPGLVVLFRRRNVHGVVQPPMP